MSDSGDLTKGEPMDGRFYVEGRRVRRRSVKTEHKDGGCSMTLDFPICDLHDAASDHVAKIIATALNRMIDSGEIK